MKILIPSNDCLTLAPDFDNAKAFRILTIIDGSIENDSFQSAPKELKGKYANGLTKSDDSSNNRDIGNQDKSKQQIVITTKISLEAQKNLQTMNWEVFFTKETNIFNALSHYLKNIVTMDSDYCCSP